MLNHVPTPIYDAVARQLRLRESATAVADPPTTTTEPPAGPEQVRLDEATTTAIRQAPTGQVVDLVLIQSGWNTSGSRYYPPDMLARDIPTVFPAGTHMYWDHATATESVERPERSLSTLAAVLVETPYTTDGGRTMRAKARVFGPYSGPVSEMWQHIGVSIHADGTGVMGERDGRRGLVVESITHGYSVDFVTRAGAGGKIVALLEAARKQAGDGLTPQVLREARNIGQWLESRLHLALTQIADEMFGDGRLTREERIALSVAIGDGLRAWTARVEQDAPQLFERDLWDDPPAATATEVSEAAVETVRDALRRAIQATHSTGSDEPLDVWLADFDPDRGLAWYEQGGRLWQRGYSLTDGQVELAAERVEVVRQIVYRPVTEPVVESDPTPPKPANPDPDPPEPDPKPADPAPAAGTPELAEPTNPDPANPADPGAPQPHTTQEETMDEKALREAAEAARDKAIKEAEQARKDAETARAELARYRALETARPIVATAVAESDLPKTAKTRLMDTTLANLPVSESGVLDEARLKLNVTEAIAAKKAEYDELFAERGLTESDGKVTGLGPATTTTTTTAGGDAAGAVTSLVEAYMRRGLSKEAAELAATGRAI